MMLTILAPGMLMGGSETATTGASTDTIRHLRTDSADSRRGSVGSSDGRIRAGINSDTRLKRLDGN